MGDPDLILKAQVAATELERAWYRWRVVHGQELDPLPTVSSYVGYSLEEPWGEPRVVLGLAADDAEQLTLLLTRHDCAGPAQRGIALAESEDANGEDVGEGGDMADGSGVAVGRPLPVPQQARSQDDQVESADARGAVSEPSARDVTDVAEPADQDAASGDSKDDVTPRGGGGTTRRRTTPAQHSTHTRQKRRSKQDEPVQNKESVRDSAYEQPTREPERIPDAAGPLTRAASAARIEAEARIRASMEESRKSRGVGWPGADPTSRAEQRADRSFMPERELPEYLDAGPEVDEVAEIHGDDGQANHTKRNRMRLGYPMSRLPRAKHPGAVPGM